MKAVINYPGAKWRLAQWIIGFFPEHHSYLEPYFGSGAVLFNKPRSNIETVNDLDGEVINLFDWIRRDPERLAYEIYYTPYARDVYETAIRNREKTSLERAVDFCICMEMGHGFRTNGEKVGWKKDIRGRERAYAAEYWCGLPDRIREASERLRGVQIENRPAAEVIKKSNAPDVLVYADPPYMLATRCRAQYRHEMTDDDHEELLDVLTHHRGPVLVSGYESELYRAYLKGWHREETGARTQNNRKRAREVLWMNFDPPGQMSLF